ncbi:MAG TPA: patatin-like phospholipase family protein [Nocardioides sp.]|uniref:patatin-like phospholipase family protein n=1 Tax=Nocardioides sp. TaxID=35761 RepID=UPI002ED9D9B7
MTIDADQGCDGSSEGLDDGTLGVALSGGGVRAALFSVGALDAVCEYAERQGKRLIVSTVSGSALLALELAWCDAPTDRDALRLVQERVARYAYWPRRRWWLIASGVVVISALVYALLQYRHQSAAGRTLSAQPLVAMAAIMMLALFRTQGIWYRPFGLTRRRRRPNLYTAMPRDFPMFVERKLSLNAFVFNATSLAEGTYASFDHTSFSATAAVREYAEASAAFPGVFLPRGLPGASGLYADGGIYDNTGLTYFENQSPSPQHVIAIEAGIAEEHPPTRPYERLAGLTRRTPRLLGIAAVVTFGGSVLGALLHLSWVQTALAGALVVAVLLMMVLVPVVAATGALSDIRWLVRGWPTTLRVATELRLANFKSRHESRGGRLTVVRLGDGPIAFQAKTQLWKLPDEVAWALIRDGRDQTAAKLETLTSVTSV